MIQVCYSYNADPKLRRTKMPKLEAQERKVLDGIAKKFQCGNLGFVYDLFLMLKSRGRALMARKKAKKQVDKLRQETGKPYIEVFRSFTQHYAFMRKLGRLPYFQKLCDVADTYDAVERIMGIFRKLYQKSRPSTCNACSLMPQCPYGQQFMHKGPDELDGQKLNEGLTHDDDCHTPPGTDMLLQAMAAMAVLMVLADDIQGGAAQAMIDGGRAGIGKDTGPTLDEPKKATAKLIAMLRALNRRGGPTPDFDATFSGEDLIEAIDKAIDDITHGQLAVLELARTFNETLLPDGSEEKEEVEYIAHDQKPREIRDPEELRKVYPSEMVDDDLMDKRLAMKELRVRQDMERRVKKQYFHIIFDVSGSMSEVLGVNKHGLHNKGSLAQALSLAVIKKVGMESGTMLFRFFAGAPDRLRIAADQDALADLARIVGLSDFNGGGTDIMSAINQACDDIKEQEKNGLGKAEILLISDGESPVDDKELEKALNGHIKLHVLDVSPSGHYSGDHKTLQKLAASYIKVDPNNLNFKDIAEAAADAAS